VGGTRRHRWRTLRIVVALCLAATAACGARLSTEQLAALDAGSAELSGSSSGGATAGSGTATTVAGATGGQAGSGAGGATGGASQGAGAAGGEGAACTATAGSTDPGISDTEVTLGWVGTISGPVPSLSQTAQNGVKAYVEYVNSQGGVCGRELSLEVGDDRLDAGANRSETNRLKDKVFAFVGGFSVVDDGGASILSGSNIPDVSLAITDSRITSPTNFSPNPIDVAANSNGTAGMMAYFKSAYGADTAFIVYPAQATARSRALAYESDFNAGGVQVVGKAEVSITQTDYSGVATQIKNSGAAIVITTLEVGGMAQLASALRTQEYQPKVPFYGAQAYSQRFIERAGAAAEGTVLGLAYDIAEDAAQNPAIAAFAEWYPRVNPGAEIDFFAIQGWAAADMFVRALTAAGGAPTRDAVLQQLRSFTDVDAGGVLAPHTNPAGKKPSPCFVVVTVQGGKWTRAHPDQGFAC
jgi:ABC-type branched-subunit amino acid transport system substrate-binding protein